MGWKMDNDKISKYVAQNDIQDFDAPNKTEAGSPAGYFDTIIYIVGGGALGSAAIGILANLTSLPDTDVSRLSGMFIGAATIAILRAKKIV